MMAQRRAERTLPQRPIPKRPIPRRPIPRRPKWQTVLLMSNLLVLALPVAGVSLFKLYDSLLIRQTESELIVQSAALGALYLDELQRAAKSVGTDLETYGRLDQAPPPEAHAPLSPAIPGLDLARHPILPPSPEALPGPPADPLARAIGRRLEPVLVETQKTTLAGLRIVDFQGRVVASSGIELGLRLNHRPEVAAALDGYRSSVLRRRDSSGPEPPPESISRDADWRVVVVFPLKLRGRVAGAVVAARTPLSVRQAIYRDRRYLLTGGLVLVMAVTFLSWLVAAVLGRPLNRLIDQAQRVERGERGAAVPLKHPGTREVALISQAVAEMAQTLESRADYISNFAANVSHELKTPLTSIQGTVELLRDHMAEMTPEELRRFLDMLEKDSHRLEKLVDRLLELARADMIRPGSETAEVQPVVGALVERFRAAGLQLDQDPVGLERGLRVAMASETLDSMLSNLVDNARHHGGGGVRVRLTIRIEGKMANLEVMDDGPGISEGNKSRIFDRFFTTRRDQGRSGLGLSIVKALVEAHRGSISLRSEPGKTVFSLRLPIA